MWTIQLLFLLEELNIVLPFTFDYDTAVLSSKNNATTFIKMIPDLLHLAEDKTTNNNLYTLSITYLASKPTPDVSITHSFFSMKYTQN